MKNPHNNTAHLHILGNMPRLTALSIRLDIARANLHHRSELGEFFLASDAVIPFFSRERKLVHGALAGTALTLAAILLGAGLFLLLNHFFPAQPRNRLIAIGAILLLRLAGIRWKLGLPVFQPRRTAAADSTQREI